MKKDSIKTNTILSFCIILCIFLVSCSASGKFKMAYNPNSIPEDIKKDGYVLLVLEQEIGTFRGIQNRGVKKMMRRHYGAPCEMVSVKDLQEPKYNDTDKYRYIIGRDFNSGQVLTTTTNMKSGQVVPAGSAGPTMTTHREYHEETIFDRKNNKAFPSIGYPSASYSLGMKGFSK